MQEVYRLDFLPMLHELIRVWFGWVEAWGYSGIVVLMAMESSIIPVPSEVVMPPAAFWAAQGKMTFVGVILAGTVGSYIGSAISYWVSRWVGAPLIAKYGRYVLLTPDKVRMAHSWVERFGATGVFVARFLPVVRHLVSIPAGILKMPFAPFSVATTIGAGLWCAILSWFGREVLGEHPELLQSPEAMVHVMKAKLYWFVGGVVALAALYSLVLIFKKKSGGATGRRARSAAPSR
jgi:membrane protein DedA with SNARE-associated domain